MLIQFVLLISLKLSPVSFAASNTEQDCYDMNKQACAVFYATNLRRTQKGLPTLKYCKQCWRMAQEQSEDMARRDYFSHDRPRFRDRRSETFAQRATRFGLTQGVAENIAQGNKNSDVVKMWMKSPGHRRNILNKRFKYFAVGFKEPYATQVFSAEDL